MTNKLGYNNIEDFYNTLDPIKSYHYILIHYKNKIVIDYSNIFGNKYMVLLSVSIKNNNMEELSLNHTFPYENNTNHFIKPKITCYQEFLDHNFYLYSPVEYQGVII